MSEQMTTIRVDGLRYVYGVDVDVALANRDAEITELKAQVAKWTELHKLHVSLPERSEDDAEMYRALDTIADLRAQLSESRQQIGNRYAEIARLLAQIAELQQQVDVWQATGNAIMQCAVGREAPLSDSDVCCEINALRLQVAELQAWQDAVPVDAIAFLVGATEAILGESWQSKTATEWVNSMPK